jgi:predicted porin
MKKNNTRFLCGLLGSVVTFGAHAQSTVELYGIVDAGITQVTGLADGTQTQLASGIMDGSRWGLKGQENIGGGFEALFTLESRIELDTGGESNRPISGTQLPDRIRTTTGLGLPSALAPVVAGMGAQFGNTLGVNLSGTAFDRQAYVGLITPAGAVIAGRQYSPAFEIMGSFDAMKTQSALSAGQLASIPSGVDIRVSNALQYRIKVNDLSGALMYAPGETAGSNANNRFWGGMVSYKTQAFALGAGYNTKNNERGQKSLTNAVFGASVEVGSGSLSMMYNSIKDENPTGLSTISTLLQSSFGLGATTANLVQSAYVNAFKQDARLFNIGYQHTFGKNSATVAYSEIDDVRASNADARSYGVAFKHSLSKRTDLNLVVAKVDNSGTSQTALGGGGYLGGVTKSAGSDSTSLAFGMRHRF